MNRLQTTYNETVLPKLMSEFGKTNKLAVISLEKVVVNVGVSKKDTADTAKLIENISMQIATITGQKPKVAQAKKSIAGFKIRQGDPVGVAVTLRGATMWEFLDKVISITLPRVKDFQGVSRKGFDSKGNYSLGFTEQIVFPEIEYDKIMKVMGLQMTVVVKNGNKTESMRLLELLGMPFEKVEEK